MIKKFKHFFDYVAQVDVASYQVDVASQFDNEFDSEFLI